MRTLAWAIEDILAAHPGLYLEHHAVMAVAMMSRLSRSPCEFHVLCEGFTPPKLNGETEFMMGVSWEEQTALRAARVWRTEQSRPVVERAAVALATLVFAHSLPGGRLRVTADGERADYWLPRLRHALEISGTEHQEELLRRQPHKIAQMLDNPRRWDGYVFICCFNKAHREIRWSFHTQEER